MLFRRISGRNSVDRLSAVQVCTRHLSLQLYPPAITYGLPAAGLYSNKFRIIFYVSCNEQRTHY